MNDINELQELKQNILHKKRIESKLSALYTKRNELQEKLRKLDAVRIKENNDVIKLEKFSLDSLFSGFIGKKDERLRKEKREAYAATAKYDSALSEYNAVTQSIARYESQTVCFSDSEEIYGKAISERLEKLKSISEYSKIINELEDRLYECDERIKELNEVIIAGNNALDSIDIILTKIKRAYYLRHKYFPLDEAYSEMKKLQNYLIDFRTELHDIEIYPYIADNEAVINTEICITDAIIDKLFSKNTILEQIQDEEELIIKTKEKIKSSQANIVRLRDKLSEERKNAFNKLESIALNTEL